MYVILTDDVANLGQMGDQVKVADGYARNFLIPRGMAVEATTRNMKQLDHQRRQIEARAARYRKGAEGEKAAMEKVSITIPVLVGEDEKLYGSVTSRDIHAALEEKGFKIDRRKIQLEDAIRQLGVFTVEVKLHRDVIASVKVWVVKEKQA